MSNVHKVHHKCDECTKTFPTKFGLVRHKIDCHGGTLDLEFHRDQGATERSLVPQQPSTPLDQIWTHTLTQIAKVLIIQERPQPTAKRQTNEIAKRSEKEEFWREDGSMQAALILSILMEKKSL